MNKILIITMLTFIVSLYSVSAYLDNTAIPSLPNFDGLFNQINNLQNNVNTLTTNVNTNTANILLNTNSINVLYQWNKTYADTLYSSISNFGNTSFNQTYTNTLYYNINTGNNLSFNLSNVNVSLTNLINSKIYDNTSWNKTLADTLYINGNGNIDYIPLFNSNNSITNSPIIINRGVEEELSVYNNTLYVDVNNSMVGVNVQSEESHAQALEVNSILKQQIGTINNIVYNVVENSTSVSSSTALPSYFVDAGLIYVNGSSYYVFNAIPNSFSFNISGNFNISSSNYSYKQAPYIDVNGLSSEERGYTISSNGTWQWALYTPHDNNSQFCIQNRNSWFNNQTNALCINTNGDTTINGRLNSETYHGEIFNQSLRTYNYVLTTAWLNITGLEIGEMQGITGNSTLGSITFSTNGLYKLIINMNAYVNNNDAVYFRFLLNETQMNKGNITYRFSTNQESTITTTFYKRFGIGDTIRMQSQDPARNTATLNILNNELIVERVGN